MVFYKSLRHDKYDILQFVIPIIIYWMYINQSLWSSFCKIVKQNKIIIGGGIAIAAILFYLRQQYDRQNSQRAIQNNLLLTNPHINQSQNLSDLEQIQIQNSRSQINSLPYPPEETDLTESEKKKCRLRSSLKHADNQHSSLQLPAKQQLPSENSSSMKTSQFKREYDNLRCCISHELLREPYSIACCGNEFEKEKIIESIQRHGKCPLCRKDVTINDLQYREKTKQFVEAFKQKALKKGVDMVHEQRY